MLKQVRKTLPVFVLISLCSSLGLAQQQCSWVFRNTPAPVKEDRWLDLDLLEQQTKDVEKIKEELSSQAAEKGLGTFEIRDLIKSKARAENREVIRQIEKIPLDPNQKERVQAPPLDVIDKVIQSLELNPVTSSKAGPLYKQPDVDIGYCFGRAAYAHLALLKMGVDKGAIRKAWVVGNMQADRVNWQFHVATIVRGTDGQRHVIDNEVGNRRVTLQEWTEHFETQDTRGDLKLYVTHPKKFSVSLGTYSQVQMGLKLDRNKDWYRGFFQDLMLWFRTGRLESVGLTRANQKIPTPSNENEVFN